MAKKVIKVKLTPDSIQNAIDEIEKFKQWILDKTTELLKELAEHGVQVAKINFSPENAMYDGMNDVKVEFEMRGDKKVAVVATGQAVLFIEFGTGILWADTHPENRFSRGEYGYGLGKMAGGWRYKGDPGTNGEVITDGKHAGEVHTYGNPANASLYLAVRDVEREFTEIARRVFGSG